MLELQQLRQLVAMEDGGSLSAAAEEQQSSAQWTEDLRKGRFACS